jgi:pilus assembly protein Flp/PilA
MSIKEKLFAFIRDEEGLTTVEYAVAGALVAAAVAASFTDLGTAVTNRIVALTGIING